MSTTYFKILASALLITGVTAQTKVVQANDDGWAVANIRAFNTALNTAGFNAIISAPADNQSGQGSQDSPRTVVGSSGCEFNSCPAGSPPTGSDPNDPRLNYVNSHPVTAMKFGISTVAPKIFNGAKPDLAVTGPNVGTNLGLVNFISGTVGAATEAAKEGIPAVAFSGVSGSQVSFETLNTTSQSTTAAEVYADLSVKLLQALLANTTSPILPPNTALNVNYPSVTTECASADNFKFVLTRVHGATIFSPKDVSTCGQTQLPSETDLLLFGSGCKASVSVMNASTKLDSDAATQQVVLDKLSSILTCS